MQLTIDSTEPLDHVLRVVESLYGVQLSTSAKPVAAKKTADTSAATTRPKRSSTAKKVAKAPAASRQGATRRGAKADPATIRNWARANGHTIQDRGRVPANILAAYKSSTRVTK